MARKRLVALIACALSICLLRPAFPQPIEENEQDDASQQVGIVERIQSSFEDGASIGKNYTMALTHGFVQFDRKGVLEIDHLFVFPQEDAAIRSRLRGTAYLDPEDTMLLYRLYRNWIEALLEEGEGGALYRLRIDGESVPIGLSRNTYSSTQRYLFLTVAYKLYEAYAPIGDIAQRGFFHEMTFERDASDNEELDHEQGEKEFDDE